jgi:predicted AAA+ superfamily ATPase
LDVTEVPEGDDLWIRGGFPDSLFAADDELSSRWRTDFVRTYLERDIPALGPRIPAELRSLSTGPDRLWRGETAAVVDGRSDPG